MILSKLIQKFPNQTHLSECCEHIVTEMTPLYCEAVETGKMKAGAVLTDGSGMEELLRLFLNCNDPSYSVSGLSNQAWDILQKVRTATWGRLAGAIADAQQRTANRNPDESLFRRGNHQTVTSSADISGKRDSIDVTDRRAAVDRYLEKLPRYQSDTEWALRFGAAGQIVKELRQILHTTKTQSTPDLVNREQQLVQFLWRKDPTVAEELGLPRINDLAQPNQREKTEFQHSDDYCSVSYEGQSYSLTKSAGKIVRMLHEAHQKGKAGVGSTLIKRQVGCGQLWDQFRRRDGRRFWNALIRKTAKDFFSLNLNAD